MARNQNLCNDEQYQKYRDAKGSDEPIIQCCKKDMCNYNIDVIISVQSNGSLQNGELLTSGMTKTLTRSRYH